MVMQATPDGGTAATRRWTLAYLVAALALVVLLYATRGWVWLAVPPIGEGVPFSDAAAQLVAGDTCALGAGDWHGEVCFLPSIDAPTHSQSYPPWIGFSRLGLTFAHYFEVAVVLVLLFHAAVAWLFRPRAARQALLLFAMTSTPAIQLCVERANFDLLTAALLVVAAWCASRDGWAGFVSACAALAAATVLKLYTGLALACAFLAQRRLSPARIAFAASATAAVVAGFGIGNLRVLGRGAPQGQTSFSTGAHWLAHHYGTTALVIAVAFALVAGTRAWSALAPVAGRASADRFRANASIVSTLTAVPLFVLMDSYDYRFALWLPALALPLAAWRNAGVRERRWLVALFAAWFVATASELAVRPLSLRAGGFAGKATLLHGLLLAKQFAAWLLAALMVAVSLRAVELLLADARAWLAARAPRRA